MCTHQLLDPGLPAAQMKMPMIQLRMSTIVFFACSGYVYARQFFQDLFTESISTVGQFMSQPNLDSVAKFLKCIESMRLKHA